MRETNELIAKFMDYEFTNYVNTDKIYKFKLNDLWWEVKDLYFHKSWDWLMPVVEKIEQDTGWELIMYSNDCYWNKFGDRPNDINRYFTGFRQEAVYEAIIWFIKWYNNKKEKY